MTAPRPLSAPPRSGGASSRVAYAYASPPVCRLRMRGDTVMHLDGSMSDGDGGNGRGSVDLPAAWTRVKRRLRAELGEDVFASWFARLELETVDGGVARLTVPTRFLKSWIESHYIDRVLTTFRAEADGVSRIEVGVRGPSGPARPSAGVPAKPNATSGPLNRLHAIATPAALQGARPDDRDRDRLAPRRFGLGRSQRCAARCAALLRELRGGPLQCAGPCRRRANRPQRQRRRAL
ncbi:protein of unknown function [Methylorubrum extorquens]|uniref:DnaA N-terminal domain-containing protein n=1 Tax=Methylorubrum extorquens TaxID=408 RepID=A0A2N9AHR5_METEX|nr:protein of unknown function [Methylorubrum extorquens]